MRILLVDKDLAFLERAAGLVERWSGRATLVVAQSPSEALASTSVGELDLVLIDAQMRDAAGIVRRLRESNGGHRLTVVALVAPTKGRVRPVVKEADLAVTKADLEAELPRLLAASH